MFFLFSFFFISQQVTVGNPTIEHAEILAQVFPLLKSNFHSECDNVKVANVFKASEEDAYRIWPDYKP